MKKKDKLTRLLLKWQRTGSGWDELFRQASEAVMEITGRRYNWDQDRCSDFYLYFYPRLVKLLQNFEYKGLSFYAILHNTISWQIKSFYRQRHTSLKMEHCLRYNSIFETEYVYDVVAADSLVIPPHIRDYLQIGPEGRISSETLSKRILMLALKNANHINDDQIKKISELTGRDAAWLVGCVEELRAKSAVRRERFKRYCLRANKAYMEICQIHRELSICECGIERCILQGKLKRLKKRLKTAREDLNSVAMTPTNREVAEVLGVPKGSVDSGLYHLRRLLGEPPLPDDVSD